MNKAFIAKVDGDIAGTIRQALDWIAWQEIVMPGSKVYIKPNLTWPIHKKGVTTTPALIEALISVLKTRTDDITVCESDKADFQFKTSEAFKGHGLYEMCEHYDARLVNLSESEPVLLDEWIEGCRVRIPVAGILLDQDAVLIDVPVMKTHSLTGISAGMKNLWGCIPDTKKILYHPYFDQGITMISNALKPGIVLIDAIHAQDGNGPFFGDPVELDTIICTNGIAASEPVACAVMGIDMKNIRHLSLAKKVGLLADMTEIDLNDHADSFRIRDFKPTKTWLNRISAFLFDHDRLNRLVHDSIFSRFILFVVNLIKKDTLKEDRELVRNRDGE